MVCGAAVDRHEDDRQRHRAVFKFVDTTKDKRAEEESRALIAATVEYGQEGEEEEYDYEYYEDGMSGDYETQFPQGMGVKAAVFYKSLFKICFSFLTLNFFPPSSVAMSSKPKNPSVILEAERTEVKRRRGKGRKGGKGKGKKRDPCLKKYKDFCIHGTCRYLKDIRTPSCV